MMFGVSHPDSLLDEGDEISVLEFHSKLQDLMLTFPTILIIQNRKEEAQYCLERWIFIWEKYKFLHTRARLTLIVASIYLNDKNRVYSDAWEKAHEALNMFTNLQDKEGKAETNLMLAMIIRMKPQRAAKNDSLFLKRQPRSDLTETHFERLPKMNKASSSLRTLKEDEKNYLKVAMQAFVELKHQYGIARVSLAVAIRNLEGLQSKQ
jgi:hypothetical protein